MTVSSVSLDRVPPFMARLGILSEPIRHVFLVLIVVLFRLVAGEVRSCNVVFGLPWPDQFLVVQIHHVIASFLVRLLL